MDGVSGVGIAWTTQANERDVESASPAACAVGLTSKPPQTQVVYDGVNGAILLECLRCVSFGDRFVIVGWASTPRRFARALARFASTKDPQESLLSRQCV